MRVIRRYASLYSFRKSSLVVSKCDGGRSFSSDIKNAANRPLGPEELPFFLPTSLYQTGPTLSQIFLLVLLAFFTTTTLHGDTTPRLFPALQPGQTLIYDIHGKFLRSTATESKVSSLRGPQELRGELAEKLQLSIGSLPPAKPYPGLTANAEVTLVDPVADPTTSPARPLSFTLLGNGEVGNLTGLEKLAPEERLLWGFWLARFAFGWTIPPQGAKPGDKWRAEEPELNDSPIVGLYWKRETTYVRNDQCPVITSETCAVFLSESTLGQKSNPKDTTPEDYRHNSLRTSGTADGTAQVITYVSLQTGLVQRATEETTESLSVTILKSDNTNGVHYNISVNSHFETLLTPNANRAP
jgi:hypothetical protein